jgi:hypothetical protein
MVTFSFALVALAMAAMAWILHLPKNAETHGLVACNEE